MVSCITAVLRERSSAVFPLRRVKKSYVRFMKGIVAIMPAQNPLWPRLFVMVFYWLTAHADAEDLVSKCDGCQRFSRRAHVPAQELRMIPITWPFAVWGLDMVGPFKRSKDKKTHLLVAVDKFTKWVEAEPVSKCDAATAVQFMKKVIFRFGFPHSIITDNGTNLSKGAMEEFCQREHIRLDVSSVVHPQSNGQAERANQEILKGIKPRLLVP